MIDPRFPSFGSGNFIADLSEKELNDADRVMCTCARCERPVNEDQEFCDKCEDLRIELSLG